MTPQILFEDDYILVINKPAGLVVNRAASVKEGTLQDWVENKFSFTKAFDTLGTLDTLDTFVSRSGIVHRIDKETSGILVIAKTPESFEDLQRQFKAREIEKTYLALVHGKFEINSGVINAPIGRLPWNRERFGILPGGRESETRYKVLSVLSSRLSDGGQSVIGKLADRKLKNQYQKTENRKQIAEFSLVDFYPKTGRTHQIRVHAKFIHHPLVGDTFYAGRKTSRGDRTWCPRLFLHAAKIEFTHPETKKRIKIEAPLPEDLNKALSHIGGAI